MTEAERYANVEHINAVMIKMTYWEMHTMNKSMPSRLKMTPWEMQDWKAWKKAKLKVVLKAVQKAKLKVVPKKKMTLPAKCWLMD